jgi:hypothetical protein
MILRRLGVTGIVIVLVGLLGCSALDRQAAVKLADEGKTWAETVRTTHSDTRVGFRRYVESQILVAKLGGRKPLPSTTELEEIKKISLVLAARTKVMDALISSYNSFEKLASYDASGEVETALNGLTDSINDYGKVLGASEPPISKVAGLIVGKAGGWIAGEIQKQQLLKSSQLLRERLTRLQLLMTREISSQKRMRTLIVETNGEAVTTLVAEGLGDPEPILKDLLGNFGMSYDRAQGLAMMMDARKSYAAARVKYEEEKKTNPNAKEPEPSVWLSAMSEIVKARVETELSIQEDLLNEVRTSLEELNKVHVKFEQGEPLSIESLTQRIIMLRQFLEEIKKLKS